MYRVLEQTPVLSDKPEVHAPGIYAYGVEAARGLCREDTLFYLMEQPENVPVIRPAEHNGRVVEAMDFVERDLSVRVLADYRPPGGSPEVESQYPF